MEFADLFSTVISSPSASCKRTLFELVAIAVTPVELVTRFILETASLTLELLMAKALVVVPFIETV